MRSRLTRGTALVLPAVLLGGVLAMAAAGVAAGVVSLGEDPCAQPTTVASSDPSAIATSDPTVTPSADPSPSTSIDPTVTPSAEPIPVVSTDPSVTPSEATPSPVVPVDPSPVTSADPAPALRVKSLVPTESMPASPAPDDPSATPTATVCPEPMIAALLAPAANELTVTPTAHALVYGDAVPAYTFTLTSNAVSPPAPINPVSLVELGLDPTVLATYVPPVCSTDHLVVVPPTTSEGSETTRTDQYTVTTSVPESPLPITCTGGVLTGYTFDTSPTAELTIAKKATTVSTPPTAGGISYGQTLHEVALTGGSGSVPGYFTFPPDSWTYTPQVGTQSHAVGFVPDDFVNHEPSVAGNVAVTVSQATPVIVTPPTASALVTGQALASSVLTGGVASTQGTFAFASPSSTPANGTALQSVTFTPTDNVNFSTSPLATVDVDVTVAAPPLDYTTRGYLGRVAMGAVTNLIRPRAMIPLAFTVANGSGAITDPSKVRSFNPVAVSCEGLVDNTTQELATTTIGRRSRLVYDAAAGQFVQFWKVPMTPGTCYRVTTTITDGDTIVAWFKTL